MVTLLVEGPFDRQVISALLDCTGYTKRQYNIFEISESSKAELLNTIQNALRQDEEIAVIIDCDYFQGQRITTLDTTAENSLKEQFWTNLARENKNFQNINYINTPFHVIGYENNGVTHAGEMECLFIPKSLYETIKPCAKQYENCIDEKLENYWGNQKIPEKYREFFKAPIPLKKNFSNTGFDSKLKQRLTSFFKDLDTNINEMRKIFNLSTFDRLRTFLSTIIN